MERSDAMEQNFKTINFNQASMMCNLIENIIEDYVFVWEINSNTFKISTSMVYDFYLNETEQNTLEEYWNKSLYEKDKKIFLDGMNRMKLGYSNINVFECRFINKKNEIVWLSFKGHSLKDENGNVSIILGHIMDIGKNIKIDYLTGLFNRSKLQEDMSNFLNKKVFSNASIMVLGIDNFKNINEKYGYLFGDKVIKHIGNKIGMILPKQAKIYKIDGDKFAIVYKNSTIKKIEILFNYIKEVMNIYYKIDNNYYFCTVSCGAAIYPKDALLYMELFEKANAAMEFAKVNGKNKLEFFCHELHKRKMDLLTFNEKIRSSIMNDFEGFELYYQPQVDAVTHKLKGAEALIRWNSSEFGKIYPLKFIPFLEESGLIINVGKWVIKESLKMCRDWQSIIKDFKMSINVSYIQLKEEGFKTYLYNCINEFNIKKNSIILELTESSCASDFNLLIEKFTEFKEDGINMAIDDFGTGYSSLNYLRNLPVNIVKIDKSFIKQLTEKNYNFTFIEYVVKLMHSINIKVCIEGVETVKEFEIVNKVNADYIQGYLFGKPESAETFYRKFIENKETIVSTSFEEF